MNLPKHHLLITWKPAYELGVPILDEQHRGFIASINTIHYFLSHGTEIDVVEHAIEVLKTFFHVHLITEEGIMFKLGYPLHGEHVEQHRQILKDMDSMVNSLHSRGDPRDILRFVRDYWNDHVLYSDHKFARWLAKEAILVE